MRRFLLSTTATAAMLVMVAMPAGAADLPVRVAPAPVYAPVPVFTWSGTYIGLNAGAAWGRHRTDLNFVPDRPAAEAGFTPFTMGFDSDSDAGFTGGAQAGSNWQVGLWVFGVETDIMWTDLGGDRLAATTLLPFTGAGNVGGFAPTRSLSVSYETNTDWLSTSRLRAGVAWDRFLVYATGGVATGNVDVDAIYTTTNTAGAGAGVTDVYAFNHEQIRLGWTAGGGVEAAITDNVTFRVEYLYVDLGDEDYQLGGFTNRGVAGTGAAANRSYFADAEVDVTAHIVRAGVNFKFGGLFGGF